MALRRLGFMALCSLLKKNVRYLKRKVNVKYLNICVFMYILNGSLPSSAKTFILLVVFLNP